MNGKASTFEISLAFRSSLMRANVAPQINAARSIFPVIIAPLFIDAYPSCRVYSVYTRASCARYTLVDTMVRLLTSATLVRDTARRKFGASFTIVSTGCRASVTRLTRSPGFLGRFAGSFTSRRCVQWFVDCGCLCGCIVVRGKLVNEIAASCESGQRKVLISSRLRMFTRVLSFFQRV